MPSLPSLGLTSAQTSSAQGGNIASPISGALLGVPDVLIIGGVVLLAILLLRS